MIDLSHGSEIGTFCNKIVSTAAESAFINYDNAHLRTRDDGFPNSAVSVRGLPIV